MAARSSAAPELGTMSAARCPTARSSRLPPTSCPRGFLVVADGFAGSRDGDPVNALFAVARAIHRVLAFKVPARAVAVIDASPSRAGWSPLLVPQLARLRGLCEALGLGVVEAPDEVHVVASYAQAALAEGHDAIVGRRRQAVRAAW